MANVFLNKCMCVCVCLLQFSRCSRHHCHFGNAPEICHLPFPWIHLTMWWHRPSPSCLHQTNISCASRQKCHASLVSPSPLCACNALSDEMLADIFRSNSRSLARRPTWQLLTNNSALRKAKLKCSDTKRTVFNYKQSTPASITARLHDKLLQGVLSTAHILPIFSCSAS